MPWFKNDQATEQERQERYRRAFGREEEPPREWTRSVQDDLREFGGNCDDNCGHFDHNGRPRDKR